MPKAKKKEQAPAPKVEAPAKNETAGKGKKAAPTLSAPQTKKMKELEGNKSAQLRYLFSEGYDRANAARAVGVIYQFANNVHRQLLAKK